jgi:hypothetical protein
MDYLYIYLPILETLPSGEWEEVEAELPGADSTTEEELTPELLVFEYQTPPVLPLQRYQFQALMSGLELFIDETEDGGYLFIISRGKRRDSEVQAYFAGI